MSHPPSNRIRFFTYYQVCAKCMQNTSGPCPQNFFVTATQSAQGGTNGKVQILIEKQGLFMTMYNYMFETELLITMTQFMKLTLPHK